LAFGYSLSIGRLNAVASSNATNAGCAVIERCPFCYLLSAICHHRVAVLLFAICYRHEVAGRNFL